MSSSTLPGVTAAPAAGQHVWHENKEYTTVSEGLAHILIPASASPTPQKSPRGDHQPQSVFYNPIQQFNRDLSVLAIKAYGEEVMERKRRRKADWKQKLTAKQEKKRKREEDGLGDTPRKTGKVEEASGPTMVGSPTEAVDQVNTDSRAATQDLEVEGRSRRAMSPHQEEGDNSVELKQAAQISEVVQVPDEESLQPASKQAEPGFTILDALSATGLRALRYAREIPFTTSVVANDLLPAATKAIALNVKHNQLEDKIRATTGNALSHMYSVAGDSSRDNKGRPIANKKYDVIDLDPYGTAAPFLDAAVQAVQDDGGLLCVTCTDPGVWASNGYPEKCFSLYGGIPMKGVHSHEAGLRLILHSIATSAARYGLAMEPLLSLSIDYYARVFVRIYKSAADVKFLAGKTMMVYNCDTGCGAWTTQMIARNKLALNKSGNGHFWKHVFGMAPTASKNCSHCGMKTHMAGPMFAGPLHSPDFIRRILDGLPSVSKDTYQTTDRIEGMLTLALEEMLPPLEEDSNSPTLTRKTKRFDPASVDLHPFFFIPSVLGKVIHSVTPHENALRGALRHLGYRVTRSHAKAGSIKTDAPWEVIWEVMREWVRQKAPIKDGAIRKNTAGWTIMGLGQGLPLENNETNAQAEAGKDETPKLEVVFDEDLGRERNGKKLLRYQVNPRENWGPMTRANGSQEP
jgi:tRNA (guanine26-N2/guanine27-N2)-dimethyltransferase